MNSHGIIGVLIPAITNALHSELLNSIYKQASGLGYDIVVFTNSTNSADSSGYSEYVAGEENIFTLVLKAKLDGIIFAAGNFSSNRVFRKVFHLIEKTNIPCVTLEREAGSFPCINVPQRDGMYLMTEHFIKFHNCRKIYCLTGPENNPESHERLYGVKQAMQDNNLKFDENDIFFGDFWKEKAAALGRRIASGDIEKPDAVICGNDVMAVTLFDTLRAEGIFAPRDILISGYDGSISAVAHFPSITTVAGKNEQLGQMAVNALYKIITGKNTESCIGHQKIIFGGSCGCQYQCGDSDIRLQEYIDKFTRNDILSELYLNSNCTAKLSEVSSMHEFIYKADRIAHIIPDWEWFDLCLCDDWAGSFENPEQFRKKCYPDKMFLAISKRIGYNEPNGFYFNTSEIIPALSEPHEPALVIITPLHRDARVYGYCAAKYKNGKDFSMNMHYINWCDAAANGLRSLQKQMYTDYLKMQMTQYSARDIQTGMYNKKGFADKLSAALINCNGKEKYVAVFITYKKMIISDTEKNTDIDMLLANTLGLLCSSGEITGRLSGKIFAVAAKTLESSDICKHIDHHITKIYELMKKIQSNISCPELPELIFSYALLSAADYDSVIGCIDRNIQNLTEKSNHAAFINSYAEKLNQLRLDMRMNPEKNWSVESMADMLGVSRSYFQKLYRIQFNISCNSDIIDARLQKSRQLLESTSLYINEIAEQCGYQNASHFMRQFKNTFGITAAGYRKKHINTL